MKLIFRPTFEGCSRNWVGWGQETWNPPLTTIFPLSTFVELDTLWPIWIQEFLFLFLWSRGIALRKVLKCHENGSNLASSDTQNTKQNSRRETLEQCDIDCLHAVNGVQWMDSCFCVLNVNNYFLNHVHFDKVHKNSTDLSFLHTYTDSLVD